MDPNIEKRLRFRVAEVARKHGVNRIAAALGISRESLLGFIAGMPVREGTKSLIRERESAGVLDFLDRAAAHEGAP
jgi:hypothetical protein